MSAPQSAPGAVPPAVADTSSPNQYHLHGSHRLGHSIRISYYPTGAGPLTTDGPIMLIYQDATQALTFREKETRIVAVSDLGTCVSVTLHMTIDTGSTSATLLVPTVVLAAGQPATVRTELITTEHAFFVGGVGHPQREQYTVTPLTGEASQGALPG